MRFAVNYTPQAAELLQAGKITFDLFKCPDWPHVVAAARVFRPVYVHFSLQTRHQTLAQVDWALIERFLVETESCHVNIHIAPHCNDFPGMTPDTRSPADYDRVLEAVLETMQLVIRRFGAENLVVENTPWDPDPEYLIPRPVIEPQFVTQVLHETGCGFLLDIAHARIAALYLEMDQTVYLNQMPVERLRELHIAGTRYDAEMACWVDHFAMTDADWQLTTDVLGRIHAGAWPKPEIVALEYGGVGPRFEWRSRPEVLTCDVPRLYALIRNNVD